MTRTRGLVYTLFGISALGLALASASFFTGSARAAVGPMPAEALALPADATFVIGVDVHKFVSSPLYVRHKEQAGAGRIDALRELQEKAGLDPEKDIDQIVIAGSHKDQAGAALVIGRFDRTRIQQAVEASSKGKATWKNQGGTTIYMFDEGRKGPSALAFIADNTLAIGTQSSVESIAANTAAPGKGLKANASLLKLVEGVAPGSTFWMVGDQSLLSGLSGPHQRNPAPSLRPASIEVGAPAAGPAGPSGPENFLAGLPPLKSIVVTGDLDPVVSFHAAGEAADAATAGKLADVLRGFLALAQLQAAQKPEFKDLATAVSVTQDQQKVLINGRFPYELLDALQPRKPAKAAAPAAAPKPGV